MLAALSNTVQPGRAAFSRPEPDTYGTGPRTLPDYRTRGIRNGDIALFKNVRIWEGRYVQFRLKAFNFTNTPTFGAPNIRNP